MILTISIAAGILIAAGLISIFFWIKEKWDKYWRDKELKSSNLPYDPNSPMVTRFQTLAGIRGRNSRRDRWNQVRMSDWL